MKKSGKMVFWLQIILNYKSYYEAFKIGVINSGFTPVATILFFPIFSDKTICDENNVPYEVNNQNASKWGNGYIPIQAEIQSAVGENEMLDKMIDYFNNKVVPYEISDALKDEMLDAMVELVDNCDLRPAAKKRLKKYYEEGAIGEFLARVFQRALLGDNKVAPSKKKKSAADKQSESLDEFNGIIRGKLVKPQTMVPATIQPDELGYVSELYAAYSDAYKVSVSKTDDLDIINCRNHFERQRKNYYLAETIYEKTRDSLRQGESDNFEILKDEVESGVYLISHDTSYSDGLKKANAVLDKAGGLPISYNTQDALFNWIGPGEKQGVCHMLVNEERLEWVDKDAKQII